MTELASSEVPSCAPISSSWPREHMSRRPLFRLEARKKQRKGRWKNHNFILQAYWIMRTWVTTSQLFFQPHVIQGISVELLRKLRKKS